MTLGNKEPSGEWEEEEWEGERERNSTAQGWATSSMCISVPHQDCLVAKFCLSSIG